MSDACVESMTFPMSCSRRVMAFSRASGSIGLSADGSFPSDIFRHEFRSGERLLERVRVVAGTEETNEPSLSPREWLRPYEPVTKPVTKPEWVRAFHQAASGSRAPRTNLVMVGVEEGDILSRAQGCIVPSRADGLLGGLSSSSGWGVVNNLPTFWFRLSLLSKV